MFFIMLILLCLLPQTDPVVLLAFGIIFNQSPNKFVVLNKFDLLGREAAIRINQKLNPDEKPIVYN
ncbi:hypothetical protein C0389_05710 [bacterium]|nr:hypothetical protein [bacterium]